MNITLLYTELEKREQQIENKLQLILDQNLNPFPFDRINKAKKLLALIYACKSHLNQDEYIEAGMCIKELEKEGLNLEIREDKKAIRK